MIGTASGCIGCEDRLLGARRLGSSCFALLLPVGVMVRMVVAVPNCGKSATGLSSAAFDQTKGWANQTGKQDEGNKASQGRR